VKKIPVKDADLEVAVRQKPTKELVAFDFGLLFTEGTNEVQIYIDDHLRESIDGLLKQHKMLILKVNALSPDVMFITPAE
jgi:hypothetical protein